MYFHKNYVYSYQDSVWRPYTYEYNSISNSAEVTIEGVSQTVSFSSSGQPISVFNVNEEYKYLIPNEIPVSEGLSALFKPEGWLLLEDNLEAMYFHKNYVYSYQDSVWRPYTYEYNSISNSAELTIEGV